MRPARVRSSCPPCPSNLCKGRGSSRSPATARRASRAWNARNSPPPSRGPSEEMDAKERWQEAGLYDPLHPAAAERLALLEYLSGRGATIEQMVDAHGKGARPGVAGGRVAR